MEKERNGEEKEKRRIRSAGGTSGPGTNRLKAKVPSPASQSELAIWQTARPCHIWHGRAIKWHGQRYHGTANRTAVPCFGPGRGILARPTARPCHPRSGQRDMARPIARPCHVSRVENLDFGPSGQRGNGTAYCTAVPCP